MDCGLSICHIGLIVGRHHCLIAPFFKVLAMGEGKADECSELTWEYDTVTRIGMVVISSFISFRLPNDDFAMTAPSLDYRTRSGFQGDRGCYSV